MRKAPLTLCVVGGGFTGAAAAIACLSRLDQPFRLVVVEPSASLGRGVAYGGHHPLHLLNVRTRDLSVRASQPGDFLNWAFRQLDQGENHAGLHDGLAHTFLPRQLFGEYVRERFFEAVEARGDVELKLVNAVATSCARDGGGFTLRFDRAESLQADVVLLATAYGLQASTPTGALAPFDSLPPERFAGAGSMVLIGSGLTMVDVLHSARRAGFQGNVTVISRRGQLPRPHASKGVVPTDVGLPHSKRIASLTASVAIACAAAEAYGRPWQAVINNVRSSIQEIWQDLPAEEQAPLSAPCPALVGCASPPPAARGAWPSPGRVQRGPRRAAARARDKGREGWRRLQAYFAAAWLERNREPHGGPCLRLHRSSARSCLTPP